MHIIWRPFTAFFFGGKGFPFLMNTMNLYQTSLALEKKTLFDRPAYVWTLLMLGTFILVLDAATVNMGILSHPLRNALIYIWCKEFPGTKMSIFGLVSVPTRLYPLVLAGLDFVLLGMSGFYAGLIGIIAGHLWWFISTYLPLHAPARLRRPNALGTPRWFRRLFVGSGSSTAGRTTSFSGGITATDYRDNQAGSAAAAVRHRWGSGQRLGGE
ncbi:Derlin-2 [Vanrija pseudolonga]|uniref:Derlin n=1 Tax=Vanrija pseudolonga TaxID=143232 RepID=A0AAF0XZP9_9TREE|nr:Derlin-2 [Vanrija pseudolonga]